MLAVAAMFATGCAKAIEGRPVAAASMGIGDASECTKVDAPMTTVEPAVAPDDSEPTMRIPQPEGWERITELDSAMIRFTMGSRALGVKDFAASAVVTIENHPGEIDADSFFEQSREAVGEAFGVTDMDYTDGTVCGLPAQTIQYVIPQTRLARPVPATALMVVAFSGNKTYGVVLTIQSPAADNPDYQRDLELITTGFQVLAQNSGPR